MKDKNYLIPKSDPFFLDKKILINFENQAKKNNSGFRILSHIKSEKLHQMVINHKKNYLIKTHRNTKSQSHIF